MRDDFAIFVLSHGRPKEAANRTIRTLQMSRYTGRWYIVLDTDDETAPEYVERFGAEHVLTFDKDEVAETFDLADNRDGPRGVIVYARNAVDTLAADLGLRYYMQLDDDYNYFAHRVHRPGALSYAYCFHLDQLLAAMIDFLEDSDALTVAFAQGGDFIGGHRNADHHDGPGTEFVHRVKRKAMNTFIARVGRPIRFTGRINEDVTAYVLRGGQGELFYTITAVSIDQADTQAQPGGMTGAYLGGGTYAKSFYTVMHAPSCVKVSTLGDTSFRVHHHVTWNHAVPKVISGSYRKAVPGDAPVRILPGEAPTGGRTRQETP